MTPISSNTGKIIPAKIPIFRLSPKAPDTIPTNVGPPEQPILVPTFHCIIISNFLLSSAKNDSYK